MRARVLQKDGQRSNCSHQRKPADRKLAETLSILSGVLHRISSGGRDFRRENSTAIAALRARPPSQAISRKGFGPFFSIRKKR